MGKKFSGKVVKSNASLLHKQVFQILRQVFPYHVIEQEYQMQIEDEGGLVHYLRFDFFIEGLGLAIECQGRQHYEYSQHFHGTEEEFKKHQKRDSLKKFWCEINDVSLIEIRYDEKPSKELIMSKISEVL